MFKKLGTVAKLIDAERKIIDYAVSEGIKYLPPQRDRRNQAKLIVTLYAWAIHLCFSPQVRNLSSDERPRIFYWAVNAAVNKHTREEHNGYVHWLTYEAPKGTRGLESQSLLRRSLAFMFFRTIDRLWLVPSLEDNIHPNTLKRVFEWWEHHPEYLDISVDFAGLKAQLDVLCVAASVAAAYTYGMTTGRFIHRSIVPRRVEELPQEIDTFLSYAAEDRLVVSQLEQALQRRDRLPWFDKSVTPQAAFDRQINNYLEDAQCAVVLWSDKSKHSEWVRAEALRAFDHGKLVSTTLDNVVPPVPFNTIQSFPLLREGDGVNPASMVPLLDFVDHRFPRKAAGS